MVSRLAHVNRVTGETAVYVSLDLDGGPLGEDLLQTDNGNDIAVANGETDNKDEERRKESSSSGSGEGEQGRTHASQTTGARVIAIDTGIGFLDHMLHALAKHGGWSLRVKAQGDLHSTKGESQLHSAPFLPFSFYCFLPNSLFTSRCPTVDCIFQ